MSRNRPYDAAAPAPQVTADAPGVARQFIDDDTMDYWRQQGWSDHEIRHWYSVQWAPRDDRGKIIRGTGGKTMSEEKYRKKMELRAIIADRDDYRQACCVCFCS